MMAEVCDGCFVGWLWYVMVAVYDSCVYVNVYIRTLQAQLISCIYVCTYIRYGSQKRKQYELLTLNTFWLTVDLNSHQQLTVSG